MDSLVQNPELEQCLNKKESMLMVVQYFLRQKSKQMLFSWLTCIKLCNKVSCPLATKAISLALITLHWKLFLCYWCKNLVIPQPLTAELFINEICRKEAVDFKVRIWNTFQNELPQIWNARVVCKVALARLWNTCLLYETGSFKCLGNVANRIWAQNTSELYKTACFPFRMERFIF